MKINSEQKAVSVGVDEGTLILAITHNEETITVGWDRWGYVADGYEVDQADLPTVMSFIRSVTGRKSNEELIKDWIEVVKLSWRFPKVYDRTLEKLRQQFKERGLPLPKVENRLEYLSLPELYQ